MAKFIVVDLGSFNIKTSEKLIFKHQFIEDNTSDTFGEEVILYKGRRCFWGRGRFSKEYNKLAKDYEISLLYALGKSTKEENINLILLLPIAQYDLKDEFKSNLEGKEFEFELNGEERKIKINKCGVLKEGLASFYSLAKRNTGRIAIMDIGGRTTDIITFIDGKIEKEFTIPFGTMDLFLDIANRENSKGDNMILEEVYSLLEHKYLDIKDYDDIIKQKTEYLLDEVKINKINLARYDLKVTGGGAEFLFGEINKVYNKAIKMNDNILSNVNGASNVGKAKGMDK